MSSSTPKPSQQAAEVDSVTAPDAPPHYPFVKLMALDRLESGIESPSGHKFEKFRALVAPYRAEALAFAYGGHVYAQAAYAASKAVEKGFLLHNVSGSFTLPGKGSIPFTFTVRHIREGATYCLRAVEVRQEQEVCFSSLCSFKKRETRYNFGHQPAHDIQDKYKIVLGGKSFEDHPLAPGVDTPAWAGEVERGLRPPVRFAGVDVRKVDMKQYNEMVDSKNHPEKYRQLHFYRLMGLPEDVDEGSDADTIQQIGKSDGDGGYDNLHICAHLYASDRNSLYLIARALDRVNNITRIASLSHTVIIHTHGAAMRTIDWASDSGKPISKWFTIEASTSRSGENRVLHQGQLWGPDGTLVATTLQDGLLRVRDEKL